MKELDKKQYKALIKREGRVAATFFFAVLTFGFGFLIDRFLALIEGMGIPVITESVWGWVGCWLTCTFIGLMSYEEELSGEVLPYLSTRPVSHRRVFGVKCGIGLMLSLLVGGLGKLILIQQIDRSWATLKFESPWSISFDFGWWYLAPCAYLAGLLASLLIPSTAPAYTVAFVGAFGVFWLGQWFIPGPLLLCPVLLFICYRLSYRVRAAK